MTTLYEAIHICDDLADEIGSASARQMSNWLWELWALRRNLRSSQTDIDRLRELVHDLLLPLTAEGFDCFGCKYDEHADCDHGYRCRLYLRALDAGVKMDPDEDPDGYPEPAGMSEGARRIYRRMMEGLTGGE